MSSEHGTVVDREIMEFREKDSLPDLSDLPVDDEWLRLIEAEYKEMPGLSLSKAQMQRLWGLEALVCDALVDALVTARVLRQTVRDTYVVASLRH